MTSFGEPTRISTFAVFRNRNFTLLWFAQLISVAGSTISWLAAALLIYRLTGSALSVSMILVVAALPSLLVGLVAGVFVDRFDRKRLMIAADLSRAVLTCAIPFLFPFGTIWLYLLVLLIGAIGQFFDPAHASVLPEVASDEELAAANSLIAISSQGVWALGFAVAGLIASQFAIEWAFYVDGLTFLVSAACIAGVRVGRNTVEQKITVGAVLSDLCAGVGLLVRTPSLRSLFVIGVPIFVGLGLLNALLLPFSLRILHATEFQYSVIEGLCSVGFIIGSLLMVRVADRLHEGQWLALSYSAMGLGYLLFALSSTVLAAMAALMLYGMISTPAVIARQLVIQRNTPNAMRGRVNSAFFVTRDVLMAGGMALAGLADVVDVRIPFVVASLVLLVAGALVLVMPGLRQSVAEWRQAMRLLRGAQVAPKLGMGRAAISADFEHLVAHLHALAGLSAEDQRSVIGQARVYEITDGTVIMRQGEIGDAVYFVLDGQAVAGADLYGAHRVLSVLHPGDFFGEIAALSGAPRTATVMAQASMTVFAIPAKALRSIMRNPLVNGIFLERIAERMARTQALNQMLVPISDQQIVRTGGPASSYATMRLPTTTSADVTMMLQIVSTETDPTGIAERMARSRTVNLRHVPARDPQLAPTAKTANLYATMRLPTTTSANAAALSQERSNSVDPALILPKPVD